MTSENTSVAPKSTKEFSCAIQLSNSSNSMIQEKSSSDLKSYTLESEQTDMKKVVKKPVVSEAMVNKIGNCVTLHETYFVLYLFSNCIFYTIFS